MIEIRVSKPLIEEVMRNGVRGCAVVEDALPDDAELTGATFELHPPAVVLLFDDGEEEITELEPVFETIP